MLNMHGTLVLSAETNALSTQQEQSTTDDYYRNIALFSSQQHIL